jgi:hypothetical protein
MLCHSYLDSYSLEEARLSAVIARRIKNNTKSALEKEFKELTEAFQNPKGDPSPELLERLNNYGIRKFAFERTNHTIDSAKINTHDLPFVATDVPDDDYLPIVACMLSIFSICVWLNVRSVLASVGILASDEDFRQIAPLYFTFTGAVDLKMENRVAYFVQHASLWLPPVSLAISTLLDAISMSNFDFVLEPMRLLFSRLLILVVFCVVTSLVSQSSSSMANRIDALLSTKGGSEPR